jgi:hypothetical protein
MQKVYRLIIIGVLMSALGSLGLSAQIKGYNIVVSVTPDHQDWNYKVGEKANFTVKQIPSLSKKRLGTSSFISHERQSDLPSEHA